MHPLLVFVFVVSTHCTGQASDQTTVTGLEGVPQVTSARMPFIESLQARQLSPSGSDLAADIELGDSFTTLGMTQSSAAEPEINDYDEVDQLVLEIMQALLSHWTDSQTHNISSTATSDVIGSSSAFRAILQKQLEKAVIERLLEQDRKWPIYNFEPTNIAIMLWSDNRFSIPDEGSLFLRLLSQAWPYFSAHSSELVNIIRSLSESALSFIGDDDQTALEFLLNPSVENGDVDLQFAVNLIPLFPSKVADRARARTLDTLTPWVWAQIFYCRNKELLLEHATDFHAFAEAIFGERQDRPRFEAAVLMNRIRYRGDCEIAEIFHGIDVKEFLPNCRSLFASSLDVDDASTLSSLSQYCYDTGLWQQFLDEVPYMSSSLSASFQIIKKYSNILHGPYDYLTFNRLLEVHLERDVSVTYWLTKDLDKSDMLLLIEKLIYWLSDDLKAIEEPSDEETIKKALHVCHLVRDNVHFRLLSSVLLALSFRSIFEDERFSLFDDLAVFHDAQLSHALFTNSMYSSFMRHMNFIRERNATVYERFVNLIPEKVKNLHASEYPDAESVDEIQMQIRDVSKVEDEYEILEHIGRDEYDLQNLQSDTETVPITFYPESVIPAPAPISANFTADGDHDIAFSRSYHLLDAGLLAQEHGYSDQPETGPSMPDQPSIILAGTKSQLDSTIAGSSANAQLDSTVDSQPSVNIWNRAETRQPQSTGRAGTTGNQLSCQIDANQRSVAKDRNKPGSAQLQSSGRVGTTDHRSAFHTNSKNRRSAPKDRDKPGSAQQQSNGRAGTTDHQSTSRMHSKNRRSAAKDRNSAGSTQPQSSGRAGMTNHQSDAQIDSNVRPSAEPHDSLLNTDQSQSELQAGILHENPAGHKRAWIVVGGVCAAVGAAFCLCACYQHSQRQRLRLEFADILPDD